MERSFHVENRRELYDALPENSLFACFAGKILPQSADAEYNLTGLFDGALGAELLMAVVDLQGGVILRRLGSQPAISPDWTARRFMTSSSWQKRPEETWRRPSLPCHPMPWRNDGRDGG